jgi:ribosomal protein L21
MQANVSVTQNQKFWHLTSRLIPIDAVRERLLCPRETDMRTRPALSALRGLLCHHNLLLCHYGRQFADGASAAVGIGLPSRLKDTASDQLKAMITRTKMAKKQSQPMVTNVPEKRNDLVQWERLDCRVMRPFVAAEITQQDIFAVIEAGPTQFKGTSGALCVSHSFHGHYVLHQPDKASTQATMLAVVPDDRIFVHKMDQVDVDDVVQFNRVLLVGTPTDTLVGRPHVQHVTVLGSVEEQIRDATTYIYKRTRATGYRRFRGFRAVCC